METSIIRASVCPDPFSMRRIDLQLPEGLTVAEMMEIYTPRGLADNAYVFIDGELVGRPLWASYVPKAGQNVIVRVIPEGNSADNKNALSIVFSIAAIGFMAWNPASWPMLAKMAVVGGLGFAAQKLGQVPVPTTPQQDARQELYSITGQSNQMNIFGPIPKVYGRMKIFPPLAARPYTEIAGDDQYLRLLYCAGYAPLTLSDFRIGDDPVSYYHDVQIETGTSVEGGGSPTTLFSNSVYELSLNDELTYSVAGDYSHHSTEAGIDADEISLDLTFPSGLVTYDADNKKTSRGVTFQIQYRLASQRYIFYDAETATFAIGETLTGGTSGAHGEIIDLIDNGTTGILLVRVDDGTFANNETITDSQGTPGSATVNGTACTHYLEYAFESSGPFVVGTVLYGGTTDAHSIITALQDDGTTGYLGLTNVTAEFSDGEDLVGDDTTVAVAVGDSVEPTWYNKDNPYGDNICPAFYDVPQYWQTPFSGTTYYSGDESFSLDDNGAYILGPKGGYDSLQPGISSCRISGADKFEFTMQMKSSAASDYYTPLAGYYIELKYYQDLLGTPAANSDGETQTVITGSFAADGVYHEIAFSGTAGPQVQYLFLNIRANTPWTKTPFYVKAPVVQLANAYSITAATINTVRKNIIIKPNIPGQYEVRVKRLTSYATGNTIDTVYWTALRAIEHVSPINKAGLEFISLRIRANGQLNGMIDQFSCIASSTLPVWNGAAWTDTDDVANCAWVFCDILKGAATRNPVLDARLDLAPILLWSLECATDGREFNAVIDERMSVFELLNKVAAVGRASFCFKDGLYSITEDKIKSDVIQVFTPRNSWGFSGQKTFMDRPHALKMRFINEDADYLPDEIMVYDDGYDATNATKFESIDTWGITSPEQVWKEGRYHIGCARLRPELMSLNADIEHVVCTRGDLARINHDVPMWGLGFARLKTKAESGGTTTITIDDTWAMEDGKRYSVRIRTATGAFGNALLDTVAGSSSSVSFSDPTKAIYNAIVAGDLCMFGIQNLESVLCLVHSITPGPDLTAKLTFVEYNPACYSTGTFPEFDTKITIPSDKRRTPPTPIVYQIRSDETVLYRATDGTLVSRILIELTRVSTPDIIPLRLQVERRESDSAQPWVQVQYISADTMNFYINDVVDGLTYDIRMRYISEFGRASAWMLVTHTVIGKTSAPPDIDTFMMRQPNILYWVYEPPLDIDGYYVRYNYGNNSNWAAGTPAHSGVLKVPFLDIGSFYGGETTFMVKAVDTSGNESANAAVLIKDMGDPDTGNIVGTIDFQGDGFGGEIVNGTISGVDLVADSDATLFYGVAAEAFYGADADLFYGSHYLEMSYTFPFVPDAQDAGVDIWLDYTVAELNDIYYRATEVYFTDEFTGVLTATWEAPTAGTWAIVSEALEVVHDHAGAYNQTMECKTDRPANGTKHYIGLRVKAEDVSETRMGVYFGGQFFMYAATKYTMTVDGDTAANPAWADDTWQYWLFEILADDTVNWYVDGAFIGTGTLQNTTVNFHLLAADPVTAGKKYYFDEVKLYTPTTDFAAWPGKIATDADMVYEMRIRTLYAYAQGQITNLDLNVDYEDVVEHIEDVAVAASGTVYLPITKTYREVVNVLLTMQDSGAETAVSAKVIDKNPGGGNGPSVETYDAAGSRAAGHIDARVKGY